MAEPSQVAFDGDGRGAGAVQTLAL